MRYAWLGVLALVGTAAMAGVFYPEGATTLHFAFEGSPNGDRPVVRPPAFYAADAGFGFVDSPGLVGNANGVQAPSYFRYDVNVPPGNYDVAVRVGSPVAGKTTVKSEGHRAMVYDVPTAARGNSIVNVTVNVRGSGVGAGAAGAMALDLDGRLTLEFIGENPSMMKLDIKPNTAAVTLFILGDGLVADREDVPRAGWGQMLPLFFKPGEVAVANYAGSGGVVGGLPDVLKAVRKGDVVLLSPELAELDGAGSAAYKAALEAGAAALRAKGAELVVVTPAPGRDFNAAGEFKNLSSMGAEDWIANFALGQKAPVVGLRMAAQGWVEKLGVEGSKAAFAWYAAGTFAGQPGELKEDGSLSAFGAFEYARMVALGLQKGKVAVGEHLYADVPAVNSDVGAFPASLGYGYLKK